jgi:predicted NodU family carbamoyl transferase
MKQSIYILGISAFWPDSAACLLRDGRVVAAASEAWFTRRRGESRFPEAAVAFCLQQEGVAPEDVATVAFGASPWRDVAALFRTSRSDTLSSGWHAIRHSGAALSHHAVLHRALRPLGCQGRISYTPWYTAHAAAFYASPFHDAAVLVLDDTAGPATGIYGTGHAERGLDIRLLSDLRGLPEDVTLAAAARLVREATRQSRLVLTGSMALRTQEMAALVDERVFDDVWIAPMPTAAGTCIGAALHTWRATADHDQRAAHHGGFRAGPCFAREAIASYLQEERVPYTPFHGEDAMTRAVVQLLAEGRKVGWFQGALDFSACGMGARNVFAAFEGRRAMAPAPEGQIQALPSVAVPLEASAEYFDLPYASPSGLMVARARGKAREKLRTLRPHARDADLARVFTVDQRHAPLVHGLLEGIAGHSGCPLLLNETLRPPDEPTACTLADAYAAFMHRGHDAMLLGPFLLDKREQPPLEQELPWLTRQVKQ